MAGRLSSASDAVNRAGPLLVAVAIAAALLYAYWPAANATWPELAKIPAALALAAAAGFAAKALVAPAKVSTQPPADHMRDRLAIMILIIGTAAIVVVVLAIFIVFARDYTLRTKLGEFGPTMFTTLVPVFSTWVGTVLAFYFSNENFRQAAQSTRELLDRTTPEEVPITRAGIMVPFEKVTKADPPPASLVGARAIVLSTLPFNDTASRVIIFDKDRHALAIIRQKRVTPDLAGKTVGDYLDKDGNKADAINFSFISETSTVEDGVRMLKNTRASDLFVTPRGAADEPVKGWVSDDILNALAQKPIKA